MRSVRSGLLLAVLCLVGLLLGALQARYKERGKVDPVSYTVQVFLRPLQSLLVKTLTAGEHLWMGMASAPLRAEERKEMEAWRQKALGLEARVEVLEREVSRLREIAKFPLDKTRKTLGADIIAYYPEEHRLQLNRGSQDGVRILSPVMTPEGLVGQVVEVSKGSCWVNLMTHPDFSVGARVLRKSSQVVGLVRGQGHSYLSLEVYNEEADVQSGDVLVTSGLSEVYPEGIVIGNITQIAVDPSYGVRRGVVVPIVNLDALHEVILLVPNR
ncbi:MAG: rod shape-determining protein MreC [Fimbriimonadales bacterium]|nr:rod shape-determining protein MreC [Fimbriimonadales bacterium]